MGAELTIKSLFLREDVKAKITELLGKRSTAFITSILHLTSQNALLANAEPMSVYQSAVIAAMLDLPLNNELGFAYIVPYKVRQQDGSFKTIAQFQIGSKGFVQLAQRSGQFKTISNVEIYEGQLIQADPLKGYMFDFSARKSDEIIGFAAYFALLNGFEKTTYMSTSEMKAHAAKYSKTYNNENGNWKKDYPGMGKKTILKLALSKYAPLSIEMQKAMITDQAIINDADTLNVTYIDNEEEQETQIDKEVERISLMLSDCKTIQEVETLQLQNPDVDVMLFIRRKQELK